MDGAGWQTSIQGYQIERAFLDPAWENTCRIRIAVKAKGKQIYSWEGHHGSDFLGSDDTLYYADYSPTVSGCSLVAVDLMTGKVIWKTEFKALDSINKEYRQQVNLCFFDSKTIRVLSHEPRGGFVAFIDRQTGNTVGHRLFREDEIQ